MRAVALSPALGSDPDAAPGWVLATGGALALHVLAVGLVLPGWDVARPAPPPPVEVTIEIVPLSGVALAPATPATTAPAEAAARPEALAAEAAPSPEAAARPEATVAERGAAVAPSARAQPEGPGAAVAPSEDADRAAPAEPGMATPATPAQRAAAAPGAAARVASDQAEVARPAAETVARSSPAPQITVAPPAVAAAPEVGVAAPVDALRPAPAGSATAPDPVAAGSVAVVPRGADAVAPVSGPVRVTDAGRPARPAPVATATPDRATDRPAEAAGAVAPVAPAQGDPVAPSSAPPPSSVGAERLAAVAPAPVAPPATGAARAGVSPARTAPPAERAPVAAPAPVAPSPGAVRPTQVRPTTPVPADPAPVAAVPDTAVPDTAAPAPDPAVVAALPPSDPVPPDPAPAAPVPEPEPQVAPSVEPGPDVAGEVAPGASDGPAAPAPVADVTAEARDAYAAVLDVLRSLPGEPCFSALPALADGRGLLLEVFGATDALLDGFAAQVAGRAGAVPDLVDRRIAAPQCAVLDFVRDVPGYPAFGTYFELEARQVESGTQLAGSIRNTARRNVHLLVIDNDGRVQRLDPFLQFFARGDVRFAVPMTLQSDGAVETWQLLMAVTDAVPFEAVRGLAGPEPAAEFFAQLEAEIAARGLNPDVALIAFSVR